MASVVLKDANLTSETIKRVAIENNLKKRRNYFKSNYKGRGKSGTPHEPSCGSKLLGSLRSAVAFWLAVGSCPCHGGRPMVVVVVPLGEMTRRLGFVLVYSPGVW